MKTTLDMEQRFAQKATYYTRRAYQAALKSGQPVVEIVDGQLIKTSPDGSTRVLKQAAPKYRLSAGKKLKVT